MSLRNPTLVLSLLLLTAPAHAFVWALLGRGALARGTLGAVERSAVAEAAAGSRMRMGQVGRLNFTDLSWLGREIGKKAIEEAIRENGTPQQNLTQANCLVIEFDGRGNYLANYCNRIINVEAFLQHDQETGSLLKIGCRGCIVQPGELAYYAPFSNIGPFVAVQSTTELSTEVPSSEPFRQQITQQPRDAGGVQPRALRSSWSQDGATLVAEVSNTSPVSIGLVVATYSLFNMARAQLFTECGGVYGQMAPYDSFSGISKDASSPTWIPPNGKVIFTVTLKSGPADRCKLTHAIVDTFAYRPGITNGQPTPLYIPIN